MTLVAALALIAFGVFLLLKAIGARRRTRGARGDAMRELRIKAIQQRQDSLGLTVGRAEACSIVMDMAYPEGVASVMSALTGDASIYFSKGGGVLGGIGHEPVRTAAVQFVREASRSVPSLAATSEFPYPAAGNIRFYVSTPAGILAGEAPESELRDNRHALSSLYHAGQNVVTELRLVSEQQGHS